MFRARIAAPFGPRAGPGEWRRRETVVGGIVDSLDVKRHLTCIFSADAVGYSSQMGRDEEGTIRVLAAHRAVIDGIIAFHQGRIVGTAGDSVLAEFPSAVEGVRCATEIQDAIKTRNDSLPEERRMLFRIGVNLGDVVVKNGDLLGDGVNVAARLQSIAEPGGICISSSVYDQITGKLDLGFRDIGDQTLKNINRPIHVYRVSGATQPVRAAPPFSVTARRSGKRMVAASTVAALLVGAAIAWQLGWLSVGHDGGRRAAVPAAPPAAAPTASPKSVETPAHTSTDVQTQRVQAEADAARIRAEAEALKRQAEAEVTRTRAEAEAARTARTKADAEAAAARIRAQAEADAVRIRDAAERQAAKVADASRSVSAAAPSTPTAMSGTSTPAGSPTAVTTAFDGTWKVTMRCEPYGVAAGFAIEFVVEVRDRYLRGGRGILGAPESLRMEGAIAADGSARLGVRGNSGDPKYDLRGAVPPGSPYRYEIMARFEGTSGTATRAERPCDVRFSRQ